jgi:predicted peptidase
MAVAQTADRLAEEVKPGHQVAAMLESSDGTKLDYLVYLPKDYDAADERAYPLMLFLHGRGESHGDIQLVAKWGPPLMAARGDDLPFVLVSPQCPGDDHWSSRKQLARLLELLEHLPRRYKIDQDRVYLTGLSMGGFGSWALAAASPEKFAAIVPICGAGDVSQAHRLKDLPIWVFHGDQDRIIPIKHSSEMVDAIRAAGGKQVRYTTLEHVGHNSWSAAYETPDLYQWMLQHKRSAAPEISR